MARLITVSNTTRNISLHWPAVSPHKPLSQRNRTKRRSVDSAAKRYAPVLGFAQEQRIDSPLCLMNESARAMRYGDSEAGGSRRRGRIHAGTDSLSKRGAPATADSAGAQRIGGIYFSRGLEPALAEEFARQLMAHDALGAHAHDELGISETLRARPIRAALASVGSLGVGAALPLLVPVGIAG